MAALKVLLIEASNVWIYLVCQGKIKNNLDENFLNKNLILSEKWLLSLSYTNIVPFAYLSS